jgi:GNAT superfamily N-acetyltransferase
MEELEIVFDPLPNDSLSRLVVDGLHAHGIAASGISTWHPVGFFLKSGRGEWLGGLMGELWGGWLYVRILWVASSARGCGNGTRLLKSAEEYAVERGCFASTLETTSYQARPFYEKLGYQVFAALEDYPPGHTKFYLRKQLAATKPISGE